MKCSSDWILISGIVPLAREHTGSARPIGPTALGVGPPHAARFEDIGRPPLRPVEVLAGGEHVVHAFHELGEFLRALDERRRVCWAVVLLPGHWTFCGVSLADAMQVKQMCLR